ncbi:MULTISPECIES: hypothetical protein [Streptomyces]|uniref:Integral membrane protein n=1 Tax=Streptomyces ramulosus TaxID=47762 RepID=A0ABW1FIU5_9ACTN
MGIENDQLVFDYLSRVGDLAQQRGLPSAARMRLVADLRAEATARIAGQKSPSVSQVKRVLSRLGTPEAVVSAAAEAAGTTGRTRPGAGSARPESAAPTAPAGASVPETPMDPGVPSAAVPETSMGPGVPSAPVAPSAPGGPGPTSAPRATDGPAAPSGAGTPPGPAEAPGPSAPPGRSETPGSSDTPGQPDASGPADPSPSSTASGRAAPAGSPGDAEPRFPTPGDGAAGPSRPEDGAAPEAAGPRGVRGLLGGAAALGGKAGAPEGTERPNRPLSLGKSGQSGASGKVPGPRDGSRPGQWSGLFRKKGAETAEAAGPRFTLAPGEAAPPHLAGADEIGDGDADWWLARPEATGVGETVPGFVGGIEIPEIWKRPGEQDDKEKAADGTPQAGGAGAEPGRPLPGLLRRALGRKKPGPAAEAPAPEPAAEQAPAARVRLSPVVTLAVLLLLAGAVLGSWFALAAGWAVTFLSRRLTHTEAKFAALGVPGLLAGGGAVWMWGRATGRWGDPIASGKMGAALLDGLPVLVRVAAVASAVFLVWRMRRWAR